MSSTNDQPDESAASDVEDAKALGQPIGVYGEGKYGECRTPTLQEQLAGADAAKAPSVEKVEA